MNPREILTVAEMTAADHAAVEAGTPSRTLMERAGAAVAEAVIARYPKSPVRVLAGPGNNGGDAYVAGRLLEAKGWPVRLEALVPPKSEDAISAASDWGRSAEPLKDTADGSIVVDGLFGAGLDRPLPPEVARLARNLERTKARVVAIDTPSGLSGDAGRPVGPVCFQASVTVTFHRRKPGHVLQPGRALCGEVVVADIGLGATSSKLFENGPELWLDRYPWPSVSAYKQSRGRVGVISGEAWHTGAARLAARGALRIGAGLVTVLSPPESLMVNASHLEAVMLRPFDNDVELEGLAGQLEAVIIGPAAGVTEATLANVLALARTGAALVLDADALTVFRDEPTDLFSVVDRDDVLTPHQGEFERVFPGLLKAAPERITAVRQAAARAEAVVLLKGPDTVIAAPDGRAAVNMNGTPWLATAGSGDVLAGLIGGLLAQGMDSFLAAAAAVWIHAACADAFGPGLISEDLPNLVPVVLKRLSAGGG
ncbi:MAG: NAD(P)H-hydrate dehydratase [Caulobacteraceae bacterium]|nr:NAD(P)H-hydrate dehydratase [Caulobacteraceae bacterium]